MDKLQQLTEIEGFLTSDALIEEYIHEGAVPGICKNPNCDYTTEVEPDQDKGYCENCNTNTVVSALVLAGLI